MKKVYLIFLLSSCFSLFLFSVSNNKKDKLLITKNSNNIKQLIDDSIEPHCSYELNQKYKNLNTNLQELIINIPNSRRWHKNLFNAFTDKSRIIKEKYKKRFEAKIFLKNSNNEICEFPAKLRISGDGKDHIKSKNGDIISSLDVNLIKGNIKGITKFKLFLPSTRNGASEVFMSLFLKEMGYISPRTNFLKVNLNNQSYDAIFQEKVVKEMIENNKLRESAILESDESLLWEIRSKNGSSNNGNIFPKITNNKWIKRNSINQKIGLEGAQIFSRAILESWNQAGIDKEITFSDDLLSNGNISNKKILSSYKALLISSNTTHALYNHNRKFYYDPINKTLLPIYYDGDSRILNLENVSNLSKDIKKRFLTRDIKNEDLNFAINKIKGINLSKFLLKLNTSGVKINESKLKKIKNQLIQNLIYLRNTNKVNLKNKFEHNPLDRKIQNQVNYGLVLNSTKDNIFFLCNPQEKKCIQKHLDELELNKLLVGDFILNDIKYYFLGNEFDPINNNYYQKNTLEKNLNNPAKNIFIKKFGNPKIIFNGEEKLIKIKIESLNDKILFTNSKLTDWKIKVVSNKIKKASNNESRIDTNLLTSLLTIKDSYMENLIINIEGGQHEDSLNIMNSKGTIDKILIKDSYQDAIDFDFSNIKVNDIYVENAGNDCIDTSAGQYSINKIKLFGCKDKGVSVGEESIVRIKNAEINNTNIGLASKDLSKLFLKNAILNKNNICAATYNKKQEFGPSYIAIPKEACLREKMAIQNGSTIETK